MQIGILPHAAVPHLIPSFRICRELLKWNHGVHIFGSDAFAIFRGHSDVWGDQLARFNLAGRELVHRDPRMTFPDWLVQHIEKLQLDVVILDAVWQGLAFPCHQSGLLKGVVVHHAGLPDFRSSDMPPWCFVHPGHPKDHWSQARAFVEGNERAGRGIRSTLSTIKDLSPAGRAAPDNFEFGCSEFAGLPAVHAMSFVPAAEFPQERGRAQYFGTLLAAPGDEDWTPLPPELADASRPLIACVFGTTGLQSDQHYQWLSLVAKGLGVRFPDFQVVVVAPEPARQNWETGDLPRNVSIYSWIPLWELLSTRRGAKVLLSNPGVGALREAIASATPIVAVPRRLDQFGAAARVEYFGIGSALVSPEFPEPDRVIERVGEVLGDSNVRQRSRRMKEELIAFDAGLPLKGFIESVRPR